MDEFRLITRCDSCGKFLSQKLPYYTYIIYGNSTMSEPPEPLFEHESCYERLDNRAKALLDKVCWRKPCLVEPNRPLEGLLPHQL